MAGRVGDTASKQARAKSELTVVLIPLVGGNALARLERRIEALGVPHIVVDQSGCCVGANGLVLRSGAGRQGVPYRRRLGAETVETPFVAFLEDTVVPTETWLDDIMSSFAPTDVAAVGGPVLIADSLPSRYRALGLSEFGKFHGEGLGASSSGEPVSDVATLAGANFVFRTSLLLAAMPAPEDALVDNEVYARLAGQGYRLGFAPSMAVCYSEPHVEGAKLSTRFKHGRIYASRLCLGRGAVFRTISAMKSLALPIVLTARHLRQAPPKFRKSLSLMMWVTAYNMWWSAGEFVGAAWGGAAEGLDQWL